MVYIASIPLNAWVEEHLRGTVLVALDHLAQRNALNNPLPFKPKGCLAY